MFNQFDFYFIEAWCDKKTPLKKMKKEIGCQCDIASQKTGSKRYGRKVYPTYSYTLFVESSGIIQKYNSVNEASDEMDARCDKLKRQFPEIRFYVRYHCSD